MFCMLSVSPIRSSDSVDHASTWWTDSCELVRCGAWEIESKSWQRQSTTPNGPPGDTFDPDESGPATLLHHHHHLIQAHRFPVPVHIVSIQPARQCTPHVVLPPCVADYPIFCITCATRRRGPWTTKPPLFTSLYTTPTRQDRLSLPSSLLSTTTPLLFPSH